MFLFRLIECSSQLVIPIIGIGSEELRSGSHRSEQYRRPAIEEA